MHCPLFTAKRQQLLQHIRDVIAPGCSQFLLPQIDENAYVKILLFGSSDLSPEDNNLVFRTVHNFISDTSRFQ